MDNIYVRRVSGTLLLGYVLLVALAPGPARSEVTADVFIEGLDVSSEDVKRLESGDVLAFSGADYENTDRELAADSMILVRADLAAVHAALVEETTVLPGKLIIDSGIIRDESDFDEIAFDTGDIEEVDKLLRLKPGKDYNFSEREYSWLSNELAKQRKSDEATRLSVASDAMRQVLIERYRRYRASGLEGIEGSTGKDVAGAYRGLQALETQDNRCRARTAVDDRCIRGFRRRVSGIREDSRCLSGRRGML